MFPRLIAAAAVVVVVVVMTQTFLSRWVDPNWRHQLSNAVIAWIVLGVLAAVGAGVYGWLWWSRTPIKTGSARIRIVHVQVIKAEANPAPKPWPVINVHYDNAGDSLARAIAVRTSAGIAVGRVPGEKFLEAQDSLLAWSGWDAEMKRREDKELHPGDPGDFVSIPPSRDDGFAEDFERAFDAIEKGTATVLIMLAWKYRDASTDRGVRVTEECFWMSGGNFARHHCGRGRTFLERR